MRRIIFTLSFLVFTLAVHSQTELDSLLAELPKAQKDTNYVVLLTKLSKKFAKINPEEGIVKGRAAVNVAQELGWKKGAALASQMIGYNHSRIGRYDSAIFYYVQSSSQAETIGLTKISALNSVAIGLVLVDKGEYKKAIKEYNKDINVSRSKRS
jgi:tetratricopeptide (TPR) repeat protein